MNLSEILKDWPEKKPEETTDHTNPYWPYCQSYDGKRYYSIPENEGFNTALESCDREIDGEALHGIIAQAKFDGDTSFDITEKVISTMPTWLKRIEKCQEIR